MVLSKEEREKRRRIRRNRTITIIGVIVFFALGITFCLKSTIFDVQDIIVNGNSYYTNEEIGIMGNISIGGNIFAGYDYKDCKKRLLKDTYIKDVTIEKQLPNAIVVNIVERTQVATIKYGTQYIILDYEGVYLRRSNDMPELTTINGLTLNDIKTGNVIGVDEELQFKAILRVLEAMENNEMFFYSIEVRDGMIRAYVLEGLVCVGTTDNIINALRDRSLQGAVSDMFSQGIERGTLKITDTSSTDGIIFSPKID